MTHADPSGTERLAHGIRRTQACDRPGNASPRGRRVKVREDLERNATRRADDPFTLGHT
jgi:hypothetical protein